jgi:hypothetical protein
MRLLHRMREMLLANALLFDNNSIIKFLPKTNQHHKKF